VFMIPLTKVPVMEAIEQIQCKFLHRIFLYCGEKEKTAERGKKIYKKSSKGREPQ
jgi:hypothetical protein